MILQNKKDAGRDLREDAGRDLRGLQFYFETKKLALFSMNILIIGTVYFRAQ